LHQQLTLRYTDADEDDDDDGDGDHV